jgi:arylsulfatase A-like enzyme
MVSAVDDGVGGVLNKLEELKLAENTIVVFISDNGGPEDANASNNGLLREGKGTLFEGGIRVPFAMQWPKKIQPNTKYHQPVISLDIFATVAASIPSSPKTKNELDGVNLIPFLNNAQTGVPHDYLFWRQYGPKNHAVLHHTGMKEIVLRDTTFQLYDLKNDISEEKNILNQHKELLNSFEAQRKKWLSNTIAPIFLGLSQEAEYNEMKKKQKNK